eukprot:1908932-Amphidinium_carterae.1
MPSAVPPRDSTSQSLGPRLGAMRSKVRNVLHSSQVSISGDASAAKSSLAAPYKKMQEELEEKGMKPDAGDQSHKMHKRHDVLD